MIKEVQATEGADWTHRAPRLAAEGAAEERDIQPVEMRKRRAACLMLGGIGGGTQNQLCVCVCVGRGGSQG